MQARSHDHLLFPPCCGVVGGLRSEMEIRLQYSMIVVRAINGLVDTSQQGVYADSVASIANRMDLPSWLVELRHDSTHNQLPSISVLQAASSQLLSWYVANYWSRQEARVHFLRRFCEICCHVGDPSTTSGNVTMEKCKEALMLLSGDSYSFIGNYKTPGASNVSHAKLMRDLNKMVNQQNILTVSFVTDILLPILLRSLTLPDARTEEDLSKPAAVDNAFPFPLWVYVLGLAGACSVPSAPAPMAEGSTNASTDAVEPMSASKSPAAGQTSTSTLYHALIAHRLCLFAVDSVEDFSPHATAASDNTEAHELAATLARTHAMVKFVANQYRALCVAETGRIHMLPLKEVWKAGIQESFSRASEVLAQTELRAPGTAVGLSSASVSLAAMLEVVIPRRADSETGVGEKRARTNESEEPDGSASKAGTESDFLSEFQAERAKLISKLNRCRAPKSVWEVEEKYPMAPYGHSLSGAGLYDRNSLLDLMLLAEGDDTTLLEQHP